MTSFRRVRLGTGNDHAYEGANDGVIWVNIWLHAGGNGRSDARVEFSRNYTGILSEACAASNLRSELRPWGGTKGLAPDRRTARDRGANALVWRSKQWVVGSGRPS
jgi:hypothetical protein